MYSFKFKGIIVLVLFDLILFGEDGVYMKRDSNLKDVFKTLTLLSQLGLTMVANIGTGFFLGYLLDYLLHRTILFKIIGLIMGIFSGFFSVYQIIKKATGDRK